MRVRRRLDGTKDMITDACSEVPLRVWASPRGRDGQIPFMGLERVAIYDRSRDDQKGGDEELVLGQLYPRAGEVVVRVTRGPGEERAVDFDALDAGSSSNRRARSLVRRYATGNDLRLFLTLTTEENRDRHELVTLMPGATRRLRQRLGRRVPWVWVPQDGGGQLRPHIHLMIPAKGISKSEFKSIWPWGGVEAKWLRNRASVRDTATYLAREFALPRPSGSHRYGLARGFMPERVDLVASSEAEMWDQVIELMHGRPDQVSSARAWLPEPGPRLVIGYWN